MIFSANVVEKWSFQKIALECDLSSIIRKGDIFSQKYSLGRK